MKSDVRAVMSVALVANSISIQGQFLSDVSVS